jgi:hypothetical protein
MGYRGMLNDLGIGFRLGIFVFALSKKHCGKKRSSTVHIFIDEFPTLCSTSATLLKLSLPLNTLSPLFSEHREHLYKQ